MSIIRIEDSDRENEDAYLEQLRSWIDPEHKGWTIKEAVVYALGTPVDITDDDVFDASDIQYLLKLIEPVFAGRD